MNRYCSMATAFTMTLSRIFRRQESAQALYFTARPWAGSVFASSRVMRVSTSGGQMTGGFLLGSIDLYHPEGLF